MLSEMRNIIHHQFRANSESIQDLSCLYNTNDMVILHVWMRLRFKGSSSKRGVSKFYMQIMSSNEVVSIALLFLLLLMMVNPAKERSKMFAVFCQIIEAIKCTKMPSYANLKFFMLLFLWKKFAIFSSLPNTRFFTNCF